MKRTNYISLLLSVVLVTCQALMTSSFGQSLEMKEYRVNHVADKKYASFRVLDLAIGLANEIIASFDLNGLGGYNKQCGVALYSFISQVAMFPYIAAFSEANETRVAVGDVTGDGKMEIIFANTLPSDLNPKGYIRILKDKGNFQFEVIWEMPFSEAIGDIAVGDCDNDDEMEIVVAYKYYYRALRVFEHIGNNQFVSQEIDAPFQDGNCVQVADVNNDDENEIIVGWGIWSSYDVRIYKYLDSSYEMIWSHSMWSGSPYGPYIHVYVGDTDNDDQNELVVTKSGKGGLFDQTADVYIFESIGDDFLLAWTKSFSGCGAEYPLVADVFF
ncbi:MAG: FG-GAP repeat domain-containing protein, partial [Planctomycetota bacterium]